ncbi:MAG: PAS domain S-box protein [Sideroxydans sp.]|nr:PAS domain S-box protein [Sideroxydans sp.]
MTLFSAAGESPVVQSIKPFFPLLVYAAVAALLATIYFSSIQQIESLILQEKLNYLGAIAEEKSGQITSWHDNQQRFGETFARHSLLASEFRQWLREGSPANGRKQMLLQRLEELQRADDYLSVMLLDRQGVARLSLPNGSVASAGDMRLARQAMESRQAVFSDFHRNESDGSITIDLIEPLTDAEGKPERIDGAVVIKIDPSRFLYPLIRNWPVPSASGETLLIRREGEHVLFLNELRHRKNTTLSLKIPAKTENLPAAMALRGELRTANGIDYRGVPVVAEMRRVADTSWYMVSKVDREELLGPIMQLENWASGVAVFYVAIGGLLVLAWLRGQKAQTRLLRTQHDAAIEREMLVKHFEYLTKYANDIIVVTDETGRVVEANERAVDAYGYTRDELLEMRVTDLRDTSEDPAVFAGQVEQLQKEGSLRYETRSRRKDGTLFPVEVSARLIEVEGVKYMQGISRDISERKRGEEVLRKSETLLNESQQQAHIGSWELDLVNNILYWSEENYRIFGLNHFRFGASYEAFLDTVHPDDRAYVNEVYTRSVQAREPYDIVHRLLFADGRIKHVREWCQTFYDEAGKPLRSIGTTQDITDQQEAYAALHQSAAEIEDLYNNAPCGYHSLNADGLIIRINRTELGWLGYEREEVVGRMHFTDILTPASREAFRSNFERFRLAGSVQDIEYELLRKDGSTFPVLLNAGSVYDADGNFLMSRTTLFDISAHKQAERQLAESEQRFRTMADSAPNLIWMADVADTTDFPGCSFFNQRWHDFTGRSLAQAAGLKWLECVHPEDRVRCLDTYRAAFEEWSPFKLEYRLRRYDGVYRWMRDSGVPRFTARNSFLGLIGSCIDITDHKLFDEIREEIEHVGRLNIAGEMASSLAHELSQPLSAASNYLDACLRRMEGNNWDKEGLHKSIRHAYIQTERAGAMINHMKNLVRKQKQERSMLEINTLIKDTVGFMEYELQQHYVSLALELSPLPPVLANRVEIEQILINLIKNAIDSMQSSQRRELHITTRQIESGAIMVSIRDNGKGIAADELDKVFNPFQTSKPDGLGLGLPICRSMIENYGGQIWAEQNSSGGAEFNFTLPAWGD